MALLTDIEKTVKYANGFGGVLDLNQLWFRLLSDKIYSQKAIKFAIKNYTLPAGRQASKENMGKIKLAEELVKNHLSKFGDILMVGVTGSVAAENAKTDEDIDIFVVCKKNTMWLTRLILRVYIKFIGIPHRKFGQKEKPNDFCFNLWMDESNLEVPILKQNQKNAVDLILIKVLLDKNNTFNKLISKNSWAKNYVANGYNQLRITNYELRIRDGKDSIIKRYLNYFAFLGQYLYIRLKGPVKFINLRQAFFHQNNS